MQRRVLKHSNGLCAWTWASWLLRAGIVGPVGVENVTSFTMFHRIALGDWILKPMESRARWHADGVTWKLSLAMIAVISSLMLNARWFKSFKSHWTTCDWCHLMSSDVYHLMAEWIFDIFWPWGPASAGGSFLAPRPYSTLEIWPRNAGICRCKPLLAHSSRQAVTSQGLHSFTFAHSIYSLHLFTYFIG